MINLSLPNKLTQHQKTLKDISFDNVNSVHMTQSQFQAVDFDAVKNTYYAGLKSNDALVIIDSNIGKFLFIEFKNGKISSNLEKSKIRSKIGESLLILNDIIKENLNFDKQNINYILVYNKNNNPKFEDQRQKSYINRIARFIAVDAQMSYLINGFGHYSVFFNNVKTINEDEFQAIATQLENGTYRF